MKTGLVLEGGANRGLFSAGVLDVLMENNIELDATIGVSAGAAFGCNFASKQIGRTIRYNKKYSKEWRFGSWRSFFLTGNLYSAEFAYHKLVFELDIFDFEEFKKRDFYCVCTDALTGKPLYHKSGKDDLKEMEYIRASASMPVVSKAVEVDGYKLLDGGISDAIPLEYFQSIGYKKNVVILTQPKDYRKKEMKHKKLMKFFLRKYPKIFEDLEDRHERYNKQVDFIHKQEELGNTFVIQPPVALNIKALEHDPEEKERVYRIGRQEGERILDSLKDFLNK